MKRIYKLTVISLVLVLLLQVRADAESQVHHVQPGETLFQLGEKFGISVANIIASNKYLGNPNKLICNQLLVIPETEKNNDKNKQSKTGQAEDLKPQLVIPQVPIKDNGQLQQKSAQTVLAELYQEYKGTVFLSGSSKSNKIALTFDDGPSEVTSDQVLDILKQYNVKATFFLMGQNVSKYPQVVARMVNEGHIVAGHSWSHAELDKVSSQQMQNEINYTEAAIYEVTGKSSALVRPPYGSLNREGLEFLAQNCYKVVNWSVDSLDWKYPDNGDQVIISTLPDVRGGAILLFHTLPGKEQSRIIRDVLPRIIYSLQSQGYEFVTVNELLSIPAYK